MLYPFFIKGILIEPVPHAKSKTVPDLIPFFSKYEKIIFLAKSLGTLLSSEEKEKIGRKDIVTIAITPLEGCLKYLNSKDLIICGLNDQFLPDAKNKLSNFPNSYIFPNLSHSLEAKFNYHLTLQTVENVAGIVEAYVNSLEL